jgi:hypothetical protein
MVGCLPREFPKGAGAEHSQGCQVADLSAIIADFGLMEELLAE